MAAAVGGAETGYGDCEDGSEEEEGGGGGAYGDAPFRFRTSEVAPWGEGDTPLIKVGVGDPRRGCVCACERPTYFGGLSMHPAKHFCRAFGTPLCRSPLSPPRIGTNRPLPPDAAHSAF